ncbi:MAG: class I SAM-dependent methyltransferase [Proteobacteria bacterium]|nr:class I SAM-dependent methyltransferase [Pseudomonadota bacterium]
MSKIKWDIERLERCICCDSANFDVVAKTVARCTKCAVIFNYERPTQETVNKVYDSYGHYKNFCPDYKWEKLWRDRYSRILSFCKGLSGSKLLDVGTGISTFLSFARKDFEVSGTEISFDAVEKAKELYDLDIVHAKVEEAGFKENSFDVITFWHVFEHLPLPGESLKYCKRLLKPGGIICIAVPNESGAKWMLKPWSWFLSGEKRYKNLSYAVTNQDEFMEVHLVHFTPKSLGGLLESNGFELLELTLDKNSINPHWKTAVKFFLRRGFIKIFGVNPFETIFVAARLKE